MPRVCSICAHAERAAIDQALVANEAYRTIADRFGLSHQAVMRHREHLPATLVLATAAREVTRADDLLATLKAINDRTERLYKIADGIIGKAVTTEDWRTALYAVREAGNANREARANLELLGELLGEIDRTPQVNLLLSPEWIEVRTIVLESLAPWPEAKYAMAAALMKVSRDRS